jgi:hypothetical protein
MQFATPPRELDPDDAGGKGLGDCSGYVEPGRGEYGYATVDIYFLEVRARRTAGQDARL